MSDPGYYACATAAVIVPRVSCTETKVKALRCGHCGSPSKRVPVNGYLTCEHCEVVSAVDRRPARTVYNINGTIIRSPHRIHYY